MLKNCVLIRYLHWNSWEKTLYCVQCGCRKDSKWQRNHYSIIGLVDLIYLLCTRWITSGMRVDQFLYHSINVAAHIALAHGTSVAETPTY